MEMNFIVFFIILNIVNVVIQTTKSLFTINGGKWSASIINAITYFVYTYVIVYTATDGLSTFTKALIVAFCNLLGVWIVKFIEQKTRKDRLWIFNCTAKEDNETIGKIYCILDKLDISTVYNEIVENELYSMQIFSKNQKESQMIKSVLDNYNIKYCAIETKE